MSAKSIVEASSHPDPTSLLRKKRPEHCSVSVNGTTCWLRDQKPISEKVLSRSLTDGWDISKFLEHLNKRVFMWPTVDRLGRHFTRYELEQPVILRFSSGDLLLRPNVEFSRLNSGATRCSSHWDGNAPERGPHTFQSATDYNGRPSSVAEVTFLDSCVLPDRFWTAHSPEGPWRLG